MLTENNNPASICNSEETKGIIYWNAPGFIGTENYFRIWGTLICTDGVKYMADNLNCYWLLCDIAITIIPKIISMDDTFAVIKVHLLKEKSQAEVLVDDGNYNVYYKHPVPFTDLEHNLKLFIARQGADWVIMLPSEY